MTKPKILNSFADLGKTVEVEPKYLRFEECGVSESGKTKKWLIYEKKGIGQLAFVGWSDDFKQYAYYSLGGACFTAEAIKELALFLDRINMQHLQKR